MDTLEQELIALYKTQDPEFGYNRESGGNKHKHLSEETKKKMSEKKRGTHLGEENSFYGKHHSEETKQKLREQHLGKRHSEETRKKMSNSHMGTHHDQETIEKIRLNQPFSKKVICLETGEIFPSAAQAARDKNLKVSTGVSQVCNKKRHTAAGFHWAWLEDYEKEIKENENGV